MIFRQCQLDSLGPLISAINIYFIALFFSRRFRADYDKPMFRHCVTSWSDVKVGAKLSGSVTNVTHFGAFVNIGVGRDGLIHTSAMRRHLLPPGKTALELGDRVETRVISMELDRQRIGLELVGLIR